jgi:hypothetical protein
MKRRSWVILLSLVMVPAVAPAQTKPSPLRTYETQYYTIHTDLGRDVARETELRLTRMFEGYRRRTRDFGGEVRGKLPFYLYRTEADYHAAGGTPGAAGEYDPNRRVLRAFAGDDGPNLATWYTVQHEGFHQFADQAIGRGLPIWLNEGLAEYFGEALFTGDGFVTGVVPPWRLKRVRASMEGGKFSPLREIVGLSHKEWNQRLGTTNYDLVWSLVHFLVHGDDGAYQEKLIAILKDPNPAFERHLGAIDAIETKWQAYWAQLPDDPTADLYAEATLRTLTSFLARATARRQRFESFDAFTTAAREGELKSTESEWLPPSLLRDALKRAADFRKNGGQFSLVNNAPRPPGLVYSAKNGSGMVGRFTLKGSRVDDVVIERRDGKSP